MTIPEPPRRWRVRGWLPVIYLSLLMGSFLTTWAWSPESAAQSRHSEKPYALIYGTVYDPDDRTVYGVKVYVRRADHKKPQWELYSDHAGEFAQRVPAEKAKYVVWADLRNYKPLNGKKLQAGDPVTVEVQNDERIDISLHLK